MWGWNLLRLRQLTLLIFSYRCASTSECLTKWWRLTSYLKLCFDVDNGPTHTHLACHFCCGRDHCNQDRLVPLSSTLFDGTAHHWENIPIYTSRKCWSISSILPENQFYIILPCWKKHYGQTCKRYHSFGLKTCRLICGLTDFCRHQSGFYIWVSFSIDVFSDTSFTVCTLDNIHVTCQAIKYLTCFVHSVWVSVL